jgi:hypothetical protein
MADGSTPKNDELEAVKRQLRQIHWVTIYADGGWKGLPACGCCAWLDGERKPWPCDTLRAVGFTDADIPPEVAKFAPAGGSRV